MFLKQRNFVVLVWCFLSILLLLFSSLYFDFVVLFKLFVYFSCSFSYVYNLSLFFKKHMRTFVFPISNKRMINGGSNLKRLYLLIHHPNDDCNIYQMQTCFYSKIKNNAIVPFLVFISPNSPGYTTYRCSKLLSPLLQLFSILVLECSNLIIIDTFLVI